MAAADHEDFVDASDHKSMEAPDHTTRLAARFTVAEIDGIFPFLEAERPAYPDEDDEPDDAP